MLHVLDKLSLLELKSDSHLAWPVYLINMIELKMLVVAVQNNCPSILSTPSGCCHQGKTRKVIWPL